MTTMTMKGMAIPRNIMATDMKRNTAARPGSSTRTGTKATTARIGANIDHRDAAPNTCARQRGTTTRNTPDGPMSGRTIAQRTGSMNIVAGMNAEATGATASLTIASAHILAVDTGFAFAAI